MNNNPVVFVVDDDKGMLESTVWLLESVGVEARPYTSGHAFLEAYEPNLNACILLDVRMPAMGGLNVQEALKNMGCTYPIIFVSGHADVPIVVRAFKAGAVDFIEKPYNEQLLLDSVHQALSQQHQQLDQSADQAQLQAILAEFTPREKDILLPLVKGYTSREIAEQLDISVKTVDLYRSRVMKRLQAECLPDVVGFAIAAGLVDPLNLRGG